MQEERKSSFVINFMVRAVLGMGIIFGVNKYLAYQGVSLSVGMNGLSFLTSGILGFPGVVLLYGIMAYQFL